MSEAGDYVPAPHWNGHDFKSARRAYDDVRKRTYDDAAVAVREDIKVEDYVPASITTDSEAPLVIVCDVTGSMGEWPGVIFSKLPYLEYEGQEYLGDDMQISFGAVGDCHGDKFPLQIRPFAKGKDLKAQLEKLVHEGGGGGTSQESYDLAAVYYSENCEMPEAVRKPILIFIGDEGVYSTIDKDAAKVWARVDDGKRTPEGAFEALCQKFSVYIVRKPYQCSGNSRSEADQRIESQWVKLVGGEDRVVSLPSADRVVDVIFGILAKETGRIDYFEKELKDRQGKDKDGDKKIEVVLKSLVTMHKLPKASMKKLEGPKGAKSKSVTPSKAKSKAKGSKSISLLDD